MRINVHLSAFLALVPCFFLAAADSNPPAGDKPAHLWSEPTDIASRDLFYGPGGQEHQPVGPFTFEKEDMNGTNPKYVVRGQDGVKWKVKLGEEARPEPAASRLVWAAGYFVDEDYFVANVQVHGIVPANVRRGAKQIGPDGFMHGVRMKRYPKGEDSTGQWAWAQNPFSGTRELNGLRIMMALINNWDLKDENNKVYDTENGRIYFVSDLGASFGTTGRDVTRAESKGNLNNYIHSTFIRRNSGDTVDFGDPSRPAMVHAFELPEFSSRVHMEWIGKNVPKADCRWIGKILAQLSAAQITASFRAAGYTPDEAGAFAKVVEDRIAQLNAL